MQEQSSLDFNVVKSLLHPDGERIGFHSDPSEVDDLVRAARGRGWQIEWRAKRAGASQLFWARVLDQDGREISACGGWYQNCEKAICKAIERPLLLLQASSRPGAVQLWPKKPVVPASPRTDTPPEAALVSR